ncbi:hypothetical protein FJ981_28100 [Mesorhizobium sp. B1-1-4]|uniref:hypothetical protein n=1 Tax=Mesorhizobium sp. B1-1-4 TaxID=2589980 RepID=UPI0011271135|nr:hypothetical protein [Mesorhizobium sp. B1-1-4]TPN44461.1 hypothetical protein FJ981_28100 [Mesorhizobium sp. B1-1-4]
MRSILMLVFSLVPTLAFGACSGDAKAPLQLKAWGAKQVNEATTAFHLEIVSTLTKPARMVDGYVTFKDALGKDMGAFEFPRDDVVPAGPFQKDVDVGSLVVPRILKIAKEDAHGAICVTGIIYADGTKEEFK